MHADLFLPRLVALFRARLNTYLIYLHIYVQIPTQHRFQQNRTGANFAVSVQEVGEHDLRYWVLHIIRSPRRVSNYIPRFQV